MRAAPRITQTVCEKCGAQVFESTGCPACLFEIGLEENAPANSPEVDFGCDYELLGEIGRGGQGIVYRARQKSLNRVVALKVISRGPCASHSHLKRFRREAEAAASLQHPRIVPIYEIGERDGACFFSMQLIEGGQLDEFVRREVPSPQRAAEIVASLARTAQHAHERGILHRDIKPGNILLDGEGEPHLADFGLARLVENESTITRTLDVLGTPSYIAPEQAAGDGEHLTNATDVYGLGAVLYFLLTAHPPFAGGTTYETIRLVLETEPRHPKLWNPKLDRDLATICLKCLEKDSARRYASALALAEDLERWLGHEPVQARRSSVVYRSRKWIRRNPSVVALCSLGVALVGLLAFLIWNREPPPPPAGIAVLPFENLDKKKEDALFVDGIQEDILTKLASIADLRVISHTSVTRYRCAHNVRQIGNDLRVARVLEGSVERVGSRVRINAQLIDTRTDAHLWAHTYDRELADVFATQSEIAQKIADELHANISARERAAIARAPTTDLAAYRLYVEAWTLLDPYNPDPERYSRAAELFQQAVARDPGFFLAYCGLAEAHDLIYFQGQDQTPARLVLAQAAIDSASRLQPESGEVHLALATHYYRGYFDYDRARDQLELARLSLPNDARIFELLGFIDRRQNRWHEAVRNFNRALELDPQNINILRDNKATYSMLRDYRRVAEIRGRIKAVQGQAGPAERAEGDAYKALFFRADTRPLHNLLQKRPPDDPELSAQRLMLALEERDAAAAEHALAQYRSLGGEKLQPRGVGGSALNLAYVEGLVARWRGDEAAARKAFSRARVLKEQDIRTNLDNGAFVIILGLIDAALGRKEDAFREARRALTLEPPEKDALDAADIVYYYGIICAWVGERDLAIEELRASAQMPGGIRYDEIRLDPLWDPLRKDPRFEALAESLAPHEVLP